MNKAFHCKVSPVSRAPSFHRKMPPNFTFTEYAMFPKAQKFSSQLKMTFTVRSALDISSTRSSEGTNCRGKGAMVLAIGSAVPPNCIYQSDYPDYYFRVTNSENLTDLKEKFTRICKSTEIRKRHMYLTDEMLQSNPDIAGHKDNSLDARNAILAAVPELSKQAAEKALQQWGQSRSQITHLIFHTSSGFIEQPGPDSQLIRLLGLNPAVNRVMLYRNGCFAGGTALRLAKDIAENNRGARILVVCSEITVNLFRGPSESHIGNLVAQTLFGDGAAAVIIGSDPDLSENQPIYEIISARQTLIPDTADAIHSRITEAGLYGSLSPEVAKHIGNAIGKCASDVLAPLGITDLNSLFWIVHPGGRKILDSIEHKLNLNKQKMEVSRHVLAEYGNVQSGSVFFVMEEMSRRSREERKATTGEGEEFGVLLGVGPGLTVETLVLRALPLPN